MSQIPRRRWPEGPLGFPMPDRAARAIDAILRSLPSTAEHAYRHTLVTRAPTELNPGERSDVSWISTEAVDRMREVVIARGMNDEQFRYNPLVTLGHNYDLPPVGRSVWRKRVCDGSPPTGIVGIKAKTQYPTRPETWPASEPWLPDQVFALVQAGLLRGKSVGFLPLRVHVPDEKEVKANGWTEEVRLVIDEWMLLEYACVSLPANHLALVEAVSKGELSAEVLRALGIEQPVAFATVDEIEHALRQRVAALDVAAMVGRAVDRLRGRV